MGCAPFSRPTHLPQELPGERSIIWRGGTQEIENCTQTNVQVSRDSGLQLDGGRRLLLRGRWLDQCQGWGRRSCAKKQVVYTGPFAVAGTEAVKDLAQRHPHSSIAGAHRGIGASVLYLAQSFVSNLGRLCPLVRSSPPLPPACSRLLPEPSRARAVSSVRPLWPCQTLAEHSGSPTPTLLGGVEAMMNAIDLASPAR